MKALRAAVSLIWWVALMCPAAETGFDQVRTITVTSATRHSGPIRILNWNIERGKALDAISSELQRSANDLLLLQEVDWGTRRTGEADVAAALAGRLRLNAISATEFEELGQERPGEAAYTGQATLTGLPVKAARVLRFQNQSSFWRPRRWIPSRVPLAQRRMGSRIALVTELDWGGKRLVVYNAHLESRSYGRIQMKQVEEMLADARRYPPETVVVIGGDLNSKYLPSVFLHQLERAGYRSVLGERIERTHVIAMALDWIFVKGPAEITSGGVERQARGSDHFPVVAVLRGGSER
jgi:endonuclease/exonuclease/phosphatase family metal-dependent hydrolase